jgi:hypothetical protein
MAAHEISCCVAACHGDTSGIFIPAMRDSRVLYSADETVEMAD